MGIKDLDIKVFKEYIRKERNCSDVCKKFGISIFEFSCIISRLKTNGINIIVSGKGEDASVLNLDERNLNGDNIYTIDIGNDNKFRTLLISDTRLGSKYQQLSRLNDAYLKAFDLGYTNVIHLGDISEGLYSKKSQYYTSNFLTTTDEQKEYIIDNYPYIEGMKTYFITGDQDNTHTASNGVDIGRAVSDERDDMIYLGNMRCLLNVRKCKILAQHLKIGAFDRAKTVSLKQQDFISAMRSEDRVDVILDGHLLTDLQLTERGMREISVPSLVAATPRIKSNAVPHNVGYILLDIDLTDSGKFKDLSATHAPYYQTDKDDYTRVKKLKIRSEN